MPAFTRYGDTGPDELIGWYGLSAAKSYIELHPDEKILVIEAESTCGGTWSRDRLYPGLKSNNLWGSYEHPDFPMVEEVYGVKYGEHVPAATMHRYLTDFAKHFGVFERTRFDTAVDAIEAVPGDNSWKVHVRPSKGQQKDAEIEVLHTQKLIVATGLTTNPNLPTYPGQEKYTAPFFHAKDFHRQRDAVKDCKKVVVVGAGKSALDCAYVFAAEAGATVDLVMRPTGAGPVWISPPWVTPLKRMLEELLSTRALTWFSPCPWGGEDGFGIVRSFLHNSALGQILVGNFWNFIKADVVQAHGYNEHPEVFKMKPWHSPQWTGSGVSIHNYPTNFFDLVREGKVRPHLAEIERLDADNKVYLSDGQVVDSDVIICATGWKKESGIKLQNFDVGLQKSPEERQRLAQEADKRVRDLFPTLKDQPVISKAPVSSSSATAVTNGVANGTNGKNGNGASEPMRNYRFIVPSGAVFDRNIAYAGMVSTVCTAMFASIQGLWISAFLDGKLTRAPKNDAEVLDEVMLHTQFGKWRYPCGYGANLPDFAFDSLPYVDLLMNDLGLPCRRKDTQINELLEPYKPRDYKGITQEWLALQAKK